ncbi:MAG: transporter substrate-binding domain-containing protein, partial [Pseudomonadota bacterium]
MVALLATVSPTSSAETLPVGTIERPPFAFRDKQNELTGFSVELWAEIARRSNLTYNWSEHTEFAEMIESATTGENDLAIANISITAAREASADFSQPIFDSGMAIAVKKGSGTNVFQLIWESGILLFVGGAIFLVFIIANIIWYFERGIEDARHDYFRDDYLGGVWDAFWWAFIIMTMGGFEKEVPHKIINRVLAMFWIVVSLFFISTLTAKITTALTVAELQTNIESYQDLLGKRIGVTKGSSHQQFLNNKGINTIAFLQIEDMYQSLRSEALDAIVADLPLLSYY